MLTYVAVCIAVSCLGDNVLAVSDNVLMQDMKHYGDGHNADADHEAFLGKDKGHSFDELDPTESKARLAAMLSKVDLDGSGDIDEGELEAWIKQQVMEYVKRDTAKALPNDDTNKDGKVSWEEYVTGTYGEQYLDPEKLSQEDDDEDYVQYVRRDKARFEMADTSADGILEEEEFQAFLHPEEFAHMTGVVVQETIEDMDEDKDDKISLAEYIGDFLDDDDDDGDEREWVTNERNKFTGELDKDHDGYLNREELEAWIVESETNYSLQEAKHIIEKADDNDDHVLSFDECINNYEIFVGSQATDYGRLLKEEL